MIRRIALTAGLGVLAACGAPPVSINVDAPAGLVAQAWQGGAVTIAVGGVVDHRSPIPHEVIRPWLPVMSAADEGERLDLQDSIARLDVEVAERWRDSEMRDAAEREADAARSRLRGKETISSLHERLADLTGRIAVAEAAVAATRLRDQESISIARNELAAAQGLLQRVTVAFERLTALVEAGAASPRDLARAANDLALARAEVEAPQLNLDILEQTTYAITRRRRELDRDRLIAERIGVEAEIAVRADGEQRAGHLDHSDVERRRQQIAEYGIIFAEPEIYAQAAGVLRYASRGFGVGSQPGWAPFAFMLDPGGLIVVATVSDRWRPWLAVSEAATVMITVPAMGQRVPGRIAAIAAQPEMAADGTGSVFRVHIEPLAARDQLLPGSQVDCDISLAIASGSPVASVPAWLIADRRRPAVTLAEGQRRELDGLFVGHEFLVLAGLEPGDRMLPATPAPDRRERVVGSVEPVRFHPIRSAGSGRRDGWQVRWLIPDGTRVEAGDPVAGLSYAGWGDPSQRRFEVAYAELEAEARRTRERSDVAASIGRAAAQWRQAIVVADRARFEVLVLNLVGDDPVVFERQSAVVRAENDLQHAQFRLDDLTVAAAADAVSQHEAEGRRIARDQAQLRVTRTRLAMVAAQRSEGLLTRLTTIAADRDAQAELARLREAYVTARQTGQARLARSAFSYRQAMERVQRNRSRVAGEVLFAPVAGEVYQRARSDGRLLKPGDTLNVMEPLIMPIGTARKVILECSDHHVSQLREGAPFPLIVPALGGRTIEGRIAQIGRALVPSKRNRGEDVADVRVILVTVEFTLGTESVPLLPLGSTVYADL